MKRMGGLYVALLSGAWPGLAFARDVDTGRLGTGPLGTEWLDPARSERSSVEDGRLVLALQADDEPAPGGGTEPPPVEITPVTPEPQPLATTPQTLEPRADTYTSYQQPRRSNKGRISGHMGWAFNVPLGSVRDFTAVVSPLGFEIQFNVWLLDYLSLGVSGEWATFVDNRPRSTVSVDDDTALTATAYNYTQTSSARFLVHYHFLDSGPVEPYIGPHIGVSWSSFDSEAADLVFSDTQVSVNFGAEAGILIPFGRNAPSAIVNLRYSTSPAAEFLASVENVQSLGLLLGIGF